MYGLIKATSRVQRGDTITDLTRINIWLTNKGEKAILCYGQSVRALENSVALGLQKIKDRTGLTKLVRSESFYDSIIPEIKEKEKHKFNWINYECPAAKKRMI
jgi:hypothetical protein